MSEVEVEPPKAKEKLRELLEAYKKAVKPELKGQASRPAE